MEGMTMLKALLPEANENVLSVLLSQAKVFVLGYTNREKLIPPLESVAAEVALIKYNRMGTEGETARSEGGVSQSFVDGDIPKSILTVLRRHRLAKVGGHAFEAE